VFKHTETDPDGVGRTGLVATLVVLVVAFIIALFM